MLKATLSEVFIPAELRKEKRASLAHCVARVHSVSHEALQSLNP